MRAIALALLLPTLASAQAPAPHSEDLGTVTGHIMCADTQRPARLAEVTLLSISALVAYDLGYQIPSVGSGVNGLVVHTDLAGAYTIADVPPGQYYLSVQLPGYATPLWAFTTAELKSPTPEIQQRIQRELQLVTVAPNATLQADAIIHRGGSISGSVTFDDGAPAVAVRVVLLHRDAKGKLQQLRNGAMAITNSRGHFSIESLLPGDYVMETSLVTFDQGHGEVLTNGTMKTIPMEMATSSLPVYSGNVYRQKDAAFIKVDAGEDITDADISIPLGQLHEVSGTLVANDGHPVTGQIQLLDPDTREQIANTWSQEGGAFHFLHVPEGSYIVKVTDGKDLGPEDVRYASDHKTAVTSRPTLHTYSSLEQPLIVQTDIQSLVLTVPDKPATTASE